MTELIREKAIQYFPEIREIRRHIHTHPELSFKEYNTSAYVSQKLEEWGIEHKKGIGGTGIVALVKGKNPGKKCVAIRGEMDALPIHEENDVPYHSQESGVMHACGHDVHTSCALGVIRVLNDLRDEWEGTLKVFFQPGEELNPGGATLMIADGAIENPRPEAIFALHVYPHLPSGTVGFRAGQYMACADEIYITVKGKGGHAALPHLTIDPVTIAAQVIVNLQQVISRKNNPLNPSVLSFGKIAGGVAQNVIPDTVSLAGTFRAFDSEWREEAHRLIKQITEHTCLAFDAEADIKISLGPPPLFNDPTLTEQSEERAKEYLGAEKVKPLNMRMTADDFAHYLRYMPGCYFRIGTNRNNEEFTVPVHNAHFDIDEEAMKTGIGVMAWCVVNALR